MCISFADNDIHRTKVSSLRSRITQHSTSFTSLATLYSSIINSSHDILRPSQLNLLPKTTEVKRTTSTMAIGISRIQLYSQTSPWNKNDTRRLTLKTIRLSTGYERTTFRR